jgi:hypothetical protein
MKKIATDFKAGDTFKKFGRVHTILEIIDESPKKIYFRYYDTEIKRDWGFSFLKSTMIPTK